MTATSSTKHRKTTDSSSVIQRSPQFVEELRLAFLGNKAEVGANLKRLAAKFEIPKDRLSVMARRLGFQVYVRRPWSAEEDAFITAFSGKLSLRAMAKRIKRHAVSIQIRLEQLRKSQSLVDSFFGAADLVTLFGVPDSKVQRWIARGLVGKPLRTDGGERFSEKQVREFLRKYPHEWDLSRVDQVLLKALLFSEQINDLGASR